MASDEGPVGPGVLARTTALGAEQTIRFLRTAREGLSPEHAAARLASACLTAADSASTRAREARYWN